VWASALLSPALFIFMKTTGLTFILCLGFYTLFAQTDGNDLIKSMDQVVVTASRTSRKQGVAVMKIFLQEQSDRSAFEKIVRDFSAELQSSALDILPAPAPPVYNDENADITSFRTDWSELKDTHDFFPMLKRHNVSRLHAVRIAGDYAKKVSNDTVRQLLQQASADDWEIMIFVANHGNIQIHTGPVKKILLIPGWINVMDPDFNLHLKLPDIHETWMVRKPTVDGWVHSLELFDAKGEMIVQFFGKRKPGIPENKIWQDWVCSL
jgi:putative hemin transport protein